MFNKTLVSAAAIATLLGSAAAAESYFGYEGQQEQDTTIELGEVVSDGDGMVVIYDYTGGEFGDVLGEEPVNQGANADVRVQLGTEPSGDVAAVLYLGEMTTPDDAAAWIEIDVETDAEDSSDDGNSDDGMSGDDMSDDDMSDDDDDMDNDTGGMDDDSEN